MRHVVNKERNIKQRKRFTNEQLQILEHEYLRKSNWKTKDTKRLAKLLRVNRIRIYKWHYDKKRKESGVRPSYNRSDSDEPVSDIESHEVVAENSEDSGEDY